MSTIKLFETKQVRSVWDQEREAWYFSIVDVVAVLTESANPRKYWSVLKTRLKKEGSELTTNCSQLKMQSADGKNYLTDVADTEQLLRLVQSIPSPKAEPFKQWLARVFSTLLRRVDRIVTRGRFTAQSSKEADNLVFAVLRRAISNVFRNGQVRRKGQSRAAVSDTVEADLEFVDHERLRATVAELEPEEYDLFIGKLQGATSAEIAERLSTTEGAIRQRWRVLRERLTKNLMGGDSDE